MSRGGGGGGGVLECIIEACPGGGGQHRSLSRGVEQNRSLPRGHLQVCPREVEIYKLVQGCLCILSRGGGGGVLFAIIVICRGVGLNNGIALCKSMCWLGHA